MKKILTLITIFIMMAPHICSFEPAEGFYAEYKIYRYPEDKYPPPAFILLKEHKTSEIKFLYIDEFVYRYQIIHIKDDIATLRMCLEGIANVHGYNIPNQKEVPFKRIFDIKVNLNTLEMIDDNGNPWGKWILWIDPGSYDWKEYMIMKNWNGHGEVKGWLKGPWKNEDLEKVLISPYTKNIKNYFYLTTLLVVNGEKVLPYPKFKDYGIVSSYNAYETEEGIKIESGGYYLGGEEIDTSEGKKIELEPGLFIDYYYTDEGLLFEDNNLYMDDFINRLGIVVLETGNPMILTDYGVSDKILIEPPTPETQRTSFKKEVETMVGETEETPLETPPETQITETPQKSEQKSETPLPTKQSQKETNILYYIVPILIVVLIAVFLVMKEKR